MKLKTRVDNLLDDIEAEGEETATLRMWNQRYTLLEHLIAQSRDNGSPDWTLQFRSEQVTLFDLCEAAGRRGWHLK